jgi:hypothetical protein
LKPLTEADLAWLEGRIETYRWAPEDCRRMLAELRAERDGTAGMWQGPALSPNEVVARLVVARLKEDGC